jgi:hypothetical protein
MAKKATSADKSKPATKPAKTQPPPPPQAGPARDQGMASSPPNPQAGASGSTVAEGVSLPSELTQPSGSLASLEVQPRRPLWPINAEVETRRPGDAETNSSAETEPQPTVTDAPGLSLSESPSPPVSASPPLEIVHPGKFLTGSGAHSGKVKSRFYTPKPPDLGLR